MSGLYQISLSFSYISFYLLRDPIRNFWTRVWCRECCYCFNVLIVVMPQETNTDCGVSLVSTTWPWWLFQPAFTASVILTLSKASQHAPGSCSKCLAVCHPKPLPLSNSTMIPCEIQPLRKEKFWLWSLSWQTVLLQHGLKLMGCVMKWKRWVKGVLLHPFPVDMCIIDERLRGIHAYKIPDALYLIPLKYHY